MLSPSPDAEALRQTYGVNDLAHAAELAHRAVGDHALASRSEV